MLKQTLVLVLGLVAAAGTGGCTDPSEPDRAVALSYLIIGGDPEEPWVRFEKNAGVMLVTIRSWGPAGCSEALEPLKENIAGGIRVTTRHWEFRDRVCPDISTPYFDQFVIADTSVTRLIVRGRAVIGNETIELTFDLPW